MGIRRNKVIFFINIIEKRIILRENKMHNFQVSLEIKKQISLSEWPLYRFHPINTYILVTI